MKPLFLALGLTLSASAFAQEGAPPAVPTAAPAAPSTFISQGERIEIPDAAFTIVPPVDWEVHPNYAGASLFFQAPKVEAEPGVVTYQSNIRVMVMNEPRPIDDATKDEIGKLILEKNGSLGGITNYAIRSSDKVTLQAGAEGFLYYTEFSLGGSPMMQMHIMVSSATKTFLMTYTDLASVFEAENSPGLTIAYTSMQSATVDSKPAERFTQYYIVGGGILALLVFLVIIRVIRGFNMKRLGEKIESEDSGDSSRDDDDDEPLSDVMELQSSVAQHDDDDEVMPETREAHKPTPKMKKSESAPVPPPAAKVSAPAAPAPQKKAPPAPAAPEFRDDERTQATGQNVLPRSPVQEQPESDSDAGEWKSQPVSDVSEIKPKTVVTAKKAKPQKVANPAKMKDLQADDQDNSEVARISELLPNTGDTKKKKGFFSWGKGKKNDDEENDYSSKQGHIGDEDSWDQESKKASRKAKKDEEPPMSEVAGWNLKGGDAKSRFDEEDEE